MKTETRTLLKLYYDKRSACQVLGYLMINPLTIKNTSYPLDVEDFSVGRHTWLYKAIYNLAMKGATKLSLTDVESYIANVSPITHKKFFEDSNGVDWINEIVNDVKEDNFDYYYSTLRKYSLLRSYIQQGIDVKDILNKEELNGTILEEQLANFDNLTIEDIIHCFDRRNLDSKQRFAIREDNKSRKSGEGAEELFNVMKQSPSYGYGLESNYLNAITYGAVGGRFLLESRDSGCGKTRNALKRLIGICSPYIWSFEANDFIDKSSGEMISTFRAASSFNGGFIHLVDTVSPKATFHVDMLINKVIEKEADEEKGLAAKVDVAGCIFDWRGAIIPAHFTVLLPAAMDYFVNLDANEHNPVFTELQGVMENETYTVQTTKESAFGEDIVEETTRSRKQNVITWARPEPYEWDNEATLLGSEVATAMQNRELLLAEIASRATAAIEPKAKIYNF